MLNMDLSSSDCNRHSHDPDEAADQSIDLLGFEFHRQIDLECNDDSTSQLLPDSDHKREEDNDDEDDDDFTFMLIGHDEDPNNFDDKVFEDGKIRPVFPLFDQNLLLDGEYHIEEIEELPIFPPVDKIFIESPRGFPSSKPEENKQNDDDDGATGPYCDWSKESATATTTAELNKKSNSTGFSKLWRLREIVGRSNSDGRDAFVFLKSSDTSSATAPKTSSSSKPVTSDDAFAFLKSSDKYSTTAPKTSYSSSSKPATSEGTFVKVNVAGGKARVVKQGTRAKNPAVSAHKAYLRSRGEHTEEERRRSYLPYRPELMGLFTNVHGGLSKNVHPY